MRPIRLAFIGGLLLVPIGAAFAASSVGVSVCRTLPTVALTKPAPGITTTDPSIDVEGTAEAQAKLDVLVNGAVAAEITLQDVDFKLNVPLAVGSNQIQAVVQSECGATAESNVVAVVREALPAPPSPPAPAPSAPGTSPATVNSPATSGQPTSVNPTGSGGDNSNGTAQSPPPAPGKLKITSLPANFTTDSSQFDVKGQAAPMHKVDVILNRVTIGWVQADENGNFSVRVKFSQGRNTIAFRDQITGATAQSVVFIKARPTDQRAWKKVIKYWPLAAAPVALWLVLAGPIRFIRLR